MKIISTFILIAVLFIPAYGHALPVPSDACPCNTSITGGLTGAEILAEVCPDGELAPDAVLIFNQELISVSLQDPLRDFSAGFIGFFGLPACELFAGVESLISGISDEELRACRETIIDACGLETRSIPTLSEWGLIAMAGVLGLAGFLVIRRKKQTI